LLLLLLLLLLVGFNIGWNWDDVESDDSITFSIFYLLVGAFLLALLLVYVGENSLERRHKCFVSYVEEKEYHEEVIQGKLAPLSISDKIANWYQNNFMVITFSCIYIVWVFVGVIWSCSVIGWSFLDGLYFALSSLSAGGMYSLPDDSPDWFYGFTAFYAAIGIPIMALAFGFIASVIILPFTYYDQFNLMHLKITNKEIIALNELGLNIKDNITNKEQDVLPQRTRSNSQDKVDSTFQLDQSTYFLLMMVRMKIVDTNFVTYILKKHREYIEEEEEFKNSRKNSTASNTSAITRDNTNDNTWTNTYQNTD